MTDRTFDTLSLAALHWRRIGRSYRLRNSARGAGKPVAARRVWGGVLFLLLAFVALGSACGTADADEAAGRERLDRQASAHLTRLLAEAVAINRQLADAQQVLDQYVRGSARQRTGTLETATTGAWSSLSQAERRAVVAMELIRSPGQALTLEQVKYLRRDSIDGRRILEIDQAFSTAMGNLQLIASLKEAVMEDVRNRRQSESEMAMKSAEEHIGRLLAMLREMQRAMQMMAQSTARNLR